MIAAALNHLLLNLSGWASAKLGLQSKRGIDPKKRLGNGATSRCRCVPSIIRLDKPRQFLILNPSNICLY
jgi:hypothetical protein